MGSNAIDRLKQLLKRPENKTCADCNTKQPRWASINLGCFICIRCSGIHRSVGVHISKVRSVTLDEWQSAWVDNMEKWGNKKVNQLYEAKLGNTNKPDASTGDREMEQFIRQKYEHKAFMSKGSTRKSKTEAVSSEEESESESESSEESDQSEDEKVAVNPLPKPNCSKPTSKREETQSSQAKTTKDQSGLVSKFEKVGVSELFATFDQAPTAKAAASGNNSNDFGQFGDFFGAESKPTNSASASNDKDFIMSLFQNGPVGQPAPTTGFTPNPPQQGSYSPAPTNGQYGQVPSQMQYQVMQGMPPTSTYPSGPGPAMPYATAPSYTPNAPMPNSFGPNPPSMMPPYPPQIMNMGQMFVGLQQQQQQPGPPIGQPSQQSSMPYNQASQQSSWPPQGPYQ